MDVLTGRRNGRIFRPADGNVTRPQQRHAGHPFANGDQLGERPGVGQHRPLQEGTVERLRLVQVLLNLLRQRLTALEPAGRGLVQRRCKKERSGADAHQRQPLPAGDDHYCPPRLSSSLQAAHRRPLRAKVRESFRP